MKIVLVVQRFIKDDINCLVAMDLHEVDYGINFLVRVTARLAGVFAFLFVNFEVLAADVRGPSNHTTETGFDCFGALQIEGVLNRPRHEGR